MCKILLTGGEPLVRRNLEHLVESLAAIDGIDDPAMTTNGALLAAKAAAWSGTQWRAATRRRLLTYPGG